MILPVPSRNLVSEYLPPELAEQLAVYDTLPPAARAELARHLQAILSACAACIPEQLVQAQLADPLPGRVSGAFWRGSLLFADMSGFTALSEKFSALGKQGAEEISAIINQLFDALVAEVFTHQGTLLKFGGDALTAFFDEKHLGSAHAMAASGAAVAMQQRMQDFAALETPIGTFRLGLRVGVHSGQVFAAEVGDTSHIELVVTGHEVNCVAEAQEIAAPGEVVVSDQTAALLSDAHLVPRDTGFQQIIALPDTIHATPAPPALQFSSDDTPEHLDLLVARVAALRPYLVRGLPRRFLDTASSELGEFRPVTVLFANFHDFSSLLSLPGCTADLAARLLNAYYRRAQEVVHRYDGIINKVDMYTHGDKLMALFGAPTAHEDDPLRAVRCALELEQALQEANQEIGELIRAELDPRCHSILQRSDSATRTPGALLKQHIGINTGSVFAGRVGAKQRYEYTVMGPTVNLAARLMAAAHDGSIMLSPATRAAVEHQIDVKEHIPLRLKGLAEPIVPALALRVRRKEILLSRSLTSRTRRVALVGRNKELNQLKDAAIAALQGQGRVLALVGDAGMGKTRLSDELIRALILPRDTSPETPSFAICIGDCQSYEQHMPYAALRAPLRYLLGFHPQHAPDQEAPADEGGAALALLRDHVQPLAPDFVRFTPLLGDVFGIALPETALTQALTPEQRHDRLQEMIVALIMGTARQERLLFVLEDIQWADASSLEVLHHLIDEIQREPLVLLVNYRPQPPIVEPWAEHPSTVRLLLRELPPETGIELISSLLDGEPPLALLSLVDRSQGNPLYLEELVRALVDSQALARDEQGHWQLVRPLDQVAIPSSIEGLFVARLDRLPEASYELVQVASVIGRRFQHSVLAQIYSNLAKLYDGLQDVRSAEIVITDQQERTTSYLFQHALLRDVAYEGILYARRRELHQRVAQSIEALSDSSQQEQLALLAHHYLRAEAWEPAFRYNLAAGIQSQDRYANHEALMLFNTALEIVPRLQEQQPDQDMTAQVIDLHERSGNIHALLGESDQAEALYINALALLTQWRKDHGLWRTEQAAAPLILPLPFSRLNVRLHRLLAHISERRSDYESAFDWLNRGIAWSTSETQDELARCYLLGAMIYHLQGEHARALEWAHHSLAIAEEMQLAADQAHAHKLIGNVYSEQGDFGKSTEALNQARAFFEQVNDVTGLSEILNDLGIAYDIAGRWREAIACYEQSLEISENVGDARMIAHTSNNMAVVLVGHGELQRAYQLYEHSGEQYHRIGSTRGVALTDYNRGEVLLLQGQPREALQLFEASIAMMERIGARNELPQILCLAAEATLTLQEPQQALTIANQALAIAREMDLALEEAMARRVLGQIALAQGELETAHASLEASQAMLEQLDERYELGRVLLWQARLAHASGQPELVLTTLQQSAQIFTELDAQFDLDMVCIVAQEYGIAWSEIDTVCRA